MKISFLKSLSSVLLLASLLPAQQFQFRHIILVVQENRTPDNLFYGCSIPGADVVNPGQGTVSLGTNYDLGHGHDSFLANLSGNYTTQARKYVIPADIEPYCDIALQYGFSNRMFQTNQGPSYPAHQFLISGTSAPSPSSPLFAAENTQNGAGCAVRSMVVMIDQNGNENTTMRSCFEHGTLTDLLNAKGITWRYYTSRANGIWTGPNSIAHMCGAVKNMECTGADWNNVVSNPPQVLTDISNGTLADVSWVIPASPYSDHPGSQHTGGPAWVASIVNAVGTSTYWADTAIIVTWDDWGGWYDHVRPPVGYAPQYTYGFRVPLLVISTRTPQNFVSNVEADFGSILQFVESNFRLGLIGNGTYADANAKNLDSGFFSGKPRPFTQITARKLTQNELASTDDPDDY